MELNPSGIQRFSASGGGGGIRTPEALAGLTVFKTAAFNRSATPPAFWILALSLPVCPSLGIEFVSLSEQVDTTTPTGKMVFTVLGAVAELERSLIAERVRAGLRNARARGKRLGRPRVALDAARIAALRGQGRSLRDIAAELGCSSGLVHKTLANGLR